MTPLPKHLEELRDELAFYLWNYRKNAFKDGFNSAAHFMLKDLESMAKALEFYSLKRNWGEPKDVDMRDWYIIESTDRGDKAREALKNYREKYK